MASLSKRSNGGWTIQFFGLSGRRQSISFKSDKKSAEALNRHIEAILSAKNIGQPIPSQTVAWLGEISDKIKVKLENLGLLERISRVTVEDFFCGWLEAKRVAGYKPTSLRAWKQTIDIVLSRFKTKLIKDLVHKDGVDFLAYLNASDLKPATIHKRINHSKQIFEDAVRQGELASNPWKNLRCEIGDPSENRCYVSVSDISCVIESCPNIWWKLLLGLARFGGLRVPSEVFELKWVDIDFAIQRIRVSSSKTKRKGKPFRIIPLYPSLRSLLQEAFDSPDRDSVHVFPEVYRRRAIGPMGYGGANLRTTMCRIIKRSGVKLWKRVFHSLRASCESDLAENFPLATVTKWMGNTPSVALRHYVDPTDVSFDRALTLPLGKNVAKIHAVNSQKYMQQPSAMTGKEGQIRAESVNVSGDMPEDAEPCRILQIKERECMGIEPTGSFVQTPRWF